MVETYDRDDATTSMQLRQVVGNTFSEHSKPGIRDNILNWFDNGAVAVKSKYHDNNFEINTVQLRLRI